ncbi:Ig-like domain-containing protein [Nocardioides sp. HB32]
MSLAMHASRRWLALLGAGVVAASTFAVVGPAAAASPTNTKLTTSTPAIGVGGTAKLKAVVKPVSGTSKPTGTVTFREGTVTVGTADLALVGTVQTAKLDLTTLTAGNHTFVATYNGSTDFTSSTSLSITIAVGKTATTTTASSSTPAPGPGQDVKLKAVVKQTSGTAKPTGSVTFKEGTTTLGTAALVLVGTTETAKLTIPGGLPLGKHTITASYAGSSAFEASTSTVDVTVAKAASLSTLTVTPSTTTPGKSTIAVALTAVAPATGVPSGTVTFVVDTQAPQVFALNAVGKAQFTATFPTGSTHTVSVSYAGDSVFNASTASKTFTS